MAASQKLTRSSLLALASVRPPGGKHYSVDFTGACLSHTLSKVRRCRDPKNGCYDRYPDLRAYCHPVRTQYVLPNPCRQWRCLDLSQCADSKTECRYLPKQHCSQGLLRRGKTLPNKRAVYAPQVLLSVPRCVDSTDKLCRRHFR